MTQRLPDISSKDFSSLDLTSTDISSILLKLAYYGNLSPDLFQIV